MVNTNTLVKMGSTKENADKYIEHLVLTMDKYEINTKLRKSHFLSQIFHESSCLRVANENLNYSTERLLEIYPSVFKDSNSASMCARNPKALSIKLYSGYHGRGLIQLTHKYNYESISKDLNIDFVNNLDFLSSPKFASLSAGWFWNKNNLNKLADLGALEQVKPITRKINGGYNGLEDRIRLFKIAMVNL